MTTPKVISAASPSPSDDPGAQPIFRVLHGEPTPTEVAALNAVLASLTSQAQAESEADRNGWARGHQALPGSPGAKLHVFPTVAYY